MLRGFEASLESRLREAEAAEKEVLRLQQVAEEAPRLRAQKAKEQRRMEREQNRDAAMKAVNHAVQSAAEKQAQVSALLAAAGTAVQALYASLKEIARLRQEAADSLAIADRIDYEMEVEEGEEREVSMDRDPRVWLTLSLPATVKAGSKPCWKGWIPGSITSETATSAARYPGP